MTSALQLFCICLQFMNTWALLLILIYWYSSCLFSCGCIRNQNEVLWLKRRFVGWRLLETSCCSPLALSILAAWLLYVNTVVFHYGSSVLTWLLDALLPNFPSFSFLSQSHSLISIDYYLSLFRQTQMVIWIILAITWSQILVKQEGKWGII